MTIIIGIDPGKSGAAAILWGTGAIDVTRFEKVTEADLAERFSTFKKDGIFEAGDTVAYLEQVGAMPGNAGSSMFVFGESFGFIRGLLVAYGIPYVRVTPKKWQKAVGFTGKMDKGDRKKALKQLAQQYYPSIEKMTNDMADAILIAHYGKLQEGK
jgi:crossover junction endodeoxyribonuclease RuvC